MAAVKPKLRIKHNGRIVPVKRRIRPDESVRGYEAAKTTRHNSRHFATADNRDINALLYGNLGTLRDRCRYEVRNNAYAKGMVDTLANDLIGSGPRLQIQSGNARFDQRVEESFMEFCGSEEMFSGTGRNTRSGRGLRGLLSELYNPAYCDAAGRWCFADILRVTAAVSQCEAGEGLIVLTSDPAARTDIKLRLQVVEPDRLDTPLGVAESETLQAGIETNMSGRPLYYYILDNHPGSRFNLTPMGYQKVPADSVIHFARAERAGQRRGVPWIVPSLDMFSKLRRYTLATVEAAETAANFSAIMYSDDPDIVESSDEMVESLDVFDIERNSIMSIPAGYKLDQFKAAQPMGTYKEFKHELLNEAARAINQPFNVAAANSSGYNYASGRLDWQVYFRFIKTLRSLISRYVCNRVLAAWVREAELIPGFLPAISKNARIRISWYWPGAEHVDPVKEAQAQMIRLQNNTATLKDEYANQGKDWETQLEQKAREQKKIDELGLAPAAAPPAPNQETDDEDDDE